MKEFKNNKTNRSISIKDIYEIEGLTKDQLLKKIKGAEYYQKGVENLNFEVLNGLEKIEVKDTEDYGEKHKENMSRIGIDFYFGDISKLEENNNFKKDDIEEINKNLNNYKAMVRHNKRVLTYLEDNVYNSERTEVQVLNIIKESKSKGLIQKELVEEGLYKDKIYNEPKEDLDKVYKDDKTNLIESLIDNKNKSNVKKIIDGLSYLNRLDTFYTLGSRGNISNKKDKNQRFELIKDLVLDRGIEDYSDSQIISIIGEDEIDKFIIRNFFDLRDLKLDFLKRLIDISGIKERRKDLLDLLKIELDFRDKPEEEKSSFIKEEFNNIIKKVSESNHSFMDLDSLTLSPSFELTKLCMKIDSSRYDYINSNGTSIDTVDIKGFSDILKKDIQEIEQINEEDKSFDISQFYTYPSEEPFDFIEEYRRNDIHNYEANGRTDYKERIDEKRGVLDSIIEGGLKESDILFLRKNADEYKKELVIGLKDKKDGYKGLVKKVFNTLKVEEIESQIEKKNNFNKTKENLKIDDSIKQEDGSVLYKTKEILKELDGVKYDEENRLISDSLVLSLISRMNIKNDKVNKKIGEAFKIKTKEELEIIKNVSILIKIMKDSRDDLGDLKYEGDFRSYEKKDLLMIKKINLSITDVLKRLYETMPDLNELNSFLEERGLKQIISSNFSNIKYDYVDLLDKGIEDNKEDIEGSNSFLKSLVSENGNKKMDILIKNTMPENEGFMGKESFEKQNFELGWFTNRFYQEGLVGLWNDEKTYLDSFNRIYENKTILNTIEKEYPNPLLMVKRRNPKIYELVRSILSIKKRGKLELKDIDGVLNKWFKEEIKTNILDEEDSIYFLHLIFNTENIDPSDRESFERLVNISKGKSNFTDMTIKCQFCNNKGYIEKRVKELVMTPQGSRSKEKMVREICKHEPDVIMGDDEEIPF